MDADETQIARTTETAIRIGALALMLFWVAMIIAPFVPALAWSIIIAVASYPAYAWLLGRCGDRNSVAATIFTIIALVLIILPATWLGQASVEWGTVAAERIADGSLEVPPPPDRVADWPFIGERVHDFWALASTNLSAAVSMAQPQLRAVGVWLLGTVASAGMGILQFALSIIIAGVLLANASSSAAFARQLFVRLVPQSGDEFTKLSEQTIRSVATGVIGVAFIQAALIGVGLVVMDIPGAPVWIVVCVLLGIVQLPATLVTLPIIVWVWGSHETLSAALFTAWIVPAGLADNVLKPILLGRGVEAPMLVIFIGAIGGFVAAGIIGLFVGAVIIVLAYELFLAWLQGSSVATQPSQPSQPASPSSPVS